MGHRLAAPLRASLLAALVAVPALLLADAAGLRRSGTETVEADPSPAADAAPRTRTRVRAQPPAPAPPDAAVESVAAGSAPAPRTLRCVDAEGTLLPGIAVEWEVANGTRGEATNASGVVEIDDATGNPPTATLFDGRVNRSVVLSGPLTEVVVEHLPRLEIVVIDGTTGAEVTVPSVEIRTFCSAESAEIDVPGTLLRSLTLPIDDDREGDLQVRITPPEGFATVRGIDWEGRVAPRAKRVQVVVPVFPASTWTVRAVDSDGRPVAGVRAGELDLVSARGAECTGSWSGAANVDSGRSGADGLVVVRGVPSIPLARATLEMVRYPDDDPPTGGLRGKSAPLRLDIVRAGAALDVVVHPWDGGWSGGGGGCGTGCAGRRSSRLPVAPLRVRVLAADGTVAPGVTVHAAGQRETTDEFGVAAFEQVPVGLTDVVALAHGFLPTTVQAVVGRDSEVLLQELPPRRVRVTVVDPDGRPVPSVRVLPTCEEIPGATGDMLWAVTTVAQLVGDVELATPRTDTAGVVVLDVPRGRIRYDATLIGAATSQKSSEDDVRIVLSPPGE